MIKFGAINEYADFGAGMLVVAGQVPGVRSVHKFGHNQSVATTYKPVCSGGLWQTPQVSGATTLRVKAGNAADTAAGAGAREVTVYGLDATGAEISEAIATAGETASTATTASFIRLLTIEVTASGSYATLASAASGSHTADIVIENGSGGTDWGTVPVVGFAHGRSEIGAFTIPLGFTGYIKKIEIEAESNKPVDFILLKRENILETAAPYTAMEIIREDGGVASDAPLNFEYPLGPYPALTDLSWMCKGASTPTASVDMTIVLIAD